MANMRGGSRAGGSTVLTRDNFMRFLLMVDGPGSTLDADTLDGLHAKDFASAGHNHDDIYLKLIGGTMTGPIIHKENQYWFNDGRYAVDFSNSDVKGLNALIFADSTDNEFEGIFFPKTGKSNSSRSTADYDTLYARDGKGYVNSDWILTNAMMGHGKGIDSDTVDGRHASEFLLLTGGTMTGNISMNNSGISINTDGRGLSFSQGATIYKKIGGGLRIKPHVDEFGVVITNQADEDLLIIKNSDIRYKSNKVWHGGNQGHNSGMDSDTVDGKHASDFATSGHNHDALYLKLIGGTMTGPINFATDKWWMINGEYALNLNNSDIKGINSLIFRDDCNDPLNEGIFFPKSGKVESKIASDYDNLRCLDGKILINTDYALTNAMMGHNKGIDSDKLDGLHATSFFRTDIYNSYNLGFAATDGRGVRFWDSDAYKIYMSASGSANWGGRAPGEVNSDYNMYFRMDKSNPARGFVFSTTDSSGIDNIAGIDGRGQLYLKKGITAGNNKFKIDYNEDTETIDFIFN